MMFFRRIIFSAVLIGVVMGLLNSAVQLLDVTAIIFEAERYETADVGVPAVQEHTEKSRGSNDGFERIAYSFIANILSAIGFAAVLLALMCQCQQQGLTQLSLVKGLLWGFAGFIALFVAPSLGLSPEIPGARAAALELRQAWWGLTVLASIAGLAVLAFSPVKYKILGFVSLVLPHVIGAPDIEGAGFNQLDPLAVEMLTNLHQQFIVATGISNLIFWLMLGMACAWVIQRVDSNSYENG